MAAIMAFRYLIVYPPLMREIGREWRNSAVTSRRPKNSMHASQ
jgi:hypothetical protein